MILRTIHCFSCLQPRQVSVGSGQPLPNVCDICARTEAQVKLAGYLDDLSKLSLDDRLRRIEKWIYEYKPYKEPRF